VHPSEVEYRGHVDQLRAEVATWPRERIAAAISLLRARMVIGDAPIPPSVRDWPSCRIVSVVAADHVVRGT
jgi:hypothetical protein